MEVTASRESIALDTLSTVLAVSLVSMSQLSAITLVEMSFVHSF